MSAPRFSLSPAHNATAIRPPPRPGVSGMSGGDVPVEIHEGGRATREYEITVDVYDGFVALFGDVNPLHADDGYARTLGFPGKVMHGMILHGFISHFVGMHFPGGKGVLLHSVKTQLKSPCHLGDRIRIDALVTQVSHAVGVAVMDMVLTNTTRDRVAARSKVQVGLQVGLACPAETD